MADDFEGKSDKELTEELKVLDKEGEVLRATLEDHIQTVILGGLRCFIEVGRQAVGLIEKKESRDPDARRIGNLYRQGIASFVAAGRSLVVLSKSKPISDTDKMLVEFAGNQVWDKVNLKTDSVSEVLDALDPDERDKIGASALVIVNRLMERRRQAAN